MKNSQLPEIHNYNKELLSKYPQRCYIALSKDNSIFGCGVTSEDAKMHAIINGCQYPLVISPWIIMQDYVRLRDPLKEKGLSFKLIWTTPWGNMNEIVPKNY